MTRRRLVTPAKIGRLTAATAVAFALAVPSTAMAAPVRLMVDVGHGGKDPGAVAGGLSEKDSNLDISRMVVAGARRQGWDVKTTRDTDKFVDLQDRPARANAFKADALVSIHSNSAGSKNLGHMTIYRSKASKELGYDIMKNLAPLTPYKDIGNRSDSRGLAVLRGAEVPAVIVELLSVTSPSERKLLKTPSAKREMAEAIVAGVADNNGVKYVEPKPAKAKAKPAPKPKAEERPAAPKPKPAPKPAAKPKAAPKPAPAPSAGTAAEAKPEAPTKSAPKPAPEAKANVTAQPWGFAKVWKLLFG